MYFRHVRITDGLIPRSIPGDEAVYWYTPVYPNIWMVKVEVSIFFVGIVVGSQKDTTWTK